MTTINLISIDATVQRLCEEVARQRPAASLSLRLFDDIPEPPEGGVWIYDVSGPDEARAIARMQGRDHILLVDHSTLKRQKAALAGSTSEVLLKPVSRKRLEAAVDRLILGMAQPDTALEGLVQYLIQQSLDYQEAERDKGYFIARAVHELRGPLTSLAGYCDLVLERRLGPLSSQQEGVMSRMRRSLSRLSAIVAVMEQLTNHHSGSEPLPQPSEVSYTECIERALHEVAPIIAQRRMELSLDLAPCSGTVRADAKQLEEVFINVLDNSCKYTPRGGRLTIAGYPYRHQLDTRSNGNGGGVRSWHDEAIPAPDSYRVDISDNGPEIAADRLGQIFGEHAAVALGNDRAGSGLGLAICKMIVRRHHGSIWAESSGQLTTFSIVLPITGIGPIPS